MAFWTESFTADGGLKDPKRNFRFRIELSNNASGELNSVQWWAKTVDKPKFNISATEHQYLNHTFYYPGLVTWDAVSMTVVDPQDPDVAFGFSKILEAGGYKIPDQIAADNEDFATISKGKAANALGTLRVIQMDANGAEIESWELHNAFITKVDYGSLSYGDEELTEYTIELRYDWASLTAAGGEVFSQQGS